MSLRDVERAMIVFKYFNEKMPDFHKEMPLVQVHVIKSIQALYEPLVYMQVTGSDSLRSITSALILAVSVCYHSRLQNRKEYERMISSHFVSPLILPGKEAQFIEEICWLVFNVNALMSIPIIYIYAFN